MLVISWRKETVHLTTTRGSKVPYCYGKGFLLAHLSCKSNLCSLFLMVNACTLTSTAERASCMSHHKILGFLETFNILQSALGLNLLEQPDLAMLAIVLNGFHL